LISVYRVTNAVSSIPAQQVCCVEHSISGLSLRKTESTGLQARISENLVAIEENNPVDPLLIVTASV
jgi:hypothetical protein